jgi:hypothetical protein
MSGVLGTAEHFMAAAGSFTKGPKTKNLVFSF